MSSAEMFIHHVKHLEIYYFEPDGCIFYKMASAPSEDRSAPFFSNKNMSSDDLARPEGVKVKPYSLYFNMGY